MTLKMLTACTMALLVATIPALCRPVPARADMHYPPVEVGPPNTCTQCQYAFGLSASLWGVSYSGHQVYAILDDYYHQYNPPVPMHDNAGNTWSQGGSPTDKLFSVNFPCSLRWYYTFSDNNGNSWGGYLWNGQCPAATA